MRAKVSPLYDKIIEAGWLLGLVVVPLFFNVYSSRVFEPDKIGLLRSITNLMLVAWVAKQSDAFFLRRKDTPNDTASSGSWLDRYLRVPLAVPTTLLALVYLLATITSVVPRVSLWGSYQRLQGTYSALTYMLLFMLLLQTLRRREQLQRLLTVMIMASLAPALYGLVQHNGIDPLPWGGDVTFRVAANMGNAIFIGAYLIMVIPLTVARILQLLSKRAGDAAPPTAGRWFLAFYAALLALEAFVWSSLGFGRGLLVALLCVAAIALVGLYRRQGSARYLLLGVYGSTLVVQLLCLLFSQSRGPMLGILVGAFFFGLLYTFVRRWSWATVGLVALAGVFLLALVLINVPQSPLSFVRNVPYIGRLGQVFEIEGGTGKVRVLIWEGVTDMLGDNPSRTLIGYGPEAMYVAYNPYYPPDLAHYEARNASPDRAHNETFDALVTMGVLGFVVYMYLFSSVFYYGLQALNFLRRRWQRRLYWACALAGALLGVLVPLLVDHSLRFAGVGLPVGFMAGLSVFLAVSALAGLGKRADRADPVAVDGRVILLIALISALAAHYVEIHFGIAVAVTRSYFWAEAALLVLVGQRWVPVDKAELAPQPEEAVSVARSGKKRHRGGRQASPLSVMTGTSERRSVSGSLATYAVLVGFMLLVLSWDYITNPLASAKAGEILVTSLTTLAAKQQPDVASYGLTWLLLAVVGLVSLAGVAEEALVRPRTSASWWLRSLGLVAGGALVIGWLFALSHAGRLAPGVVIGKLIYSFVSAAALIWVVLVGALWLAERGTGPTRLGWGGAAGLVLGICCLFFVEAVNIRPIEADTLYKQGLKFDQEANWDNALYFYQQAIGLTPQEDFYYLFSGRAYMEKAKTETNLQLRETYFQQSLNELVTARKLNPLNTDHTANMARLYRSWGELESDPAQKQARLDQALGYYQEATKLSPHNAQLYNEWGLVYYLVGDLDQAMAKYQESLALDQQFVQTYLLLGDIYWTQQNWPEVIGTYEKIISFNPSFVQGWSALGYAYSQVGQLDEAIAANLKVLEAAPTDYGTLKNIAILYNEQGDTASAVEYATRALAVAPDADKPVLENYIEGLSSGNQ
jgi:tetratricopeptide (TPR) repeat protein